MPSVNVYNRPDLVMYAVEFARPLLPLVESGDLPADQIADLQIQNRLFAQSGKISPLFEQVNSQVLNYLKAQASKVSPGNTIGIKRRLAHNTVLEGLGSLGSLWEKITGAARSVYETGEDALTEVGEWVSTAEGGGLINVQVPEVDRALEELKSGGLLRIQPTFSAESLKNLFGGLPGWVLPAGIGLIVYLLLRRR